MNRSELHRLSQARVREARTLMKAGHVNGAYYLIGYAVECALKACIARSVKRYQFPELGTVKRSYTHNLVELTKVAGLEPVLQTEFKTNPQFELNWAVVKDWSEQARYSLVITVAQARDMYAAVTNRRNGVLPWLRKHW